MLVYGIMIAVAYKITKGKAPAKKSFACAGCPSASMCLKGSCAENAQIKEESANGNV